MDLDERMAADPARDDLPILATELADAPNAFAAWAPTVFSLVMRSL